MNNTDMVLNIIKKSEKNLSAYEILNKFQKIKKCQPMTVYRASDRLMEKREIHKSNHNKTYLLCCQNLDKKHNPSIAICKKCGLTEELRSDIFFNLLKNLRLKKYDFSNFEVEISALCRSCI